MKTLLCFLLAVIAASGLGAFYAHVTGTPTRPTLAWAPGPGSEPEKKAFVPLNSGEGVIVTFPNGGCVYKDSGTGLLSDAGATCPAASLPIAKPVDPGKLTWSSIGTVVASRKTISSYPLIIKQAPLGGFVIHQCKAGDIAVWTSDHDLGCVTPPTFSEPHVDDGRPQ